MTRLPRGRHLAPLAGPPRHRVRAAVLADRARRARLGGRRSRSPWGGINWTPTEDFCLLTGNSSIYQSLRAGVALADLLDDPQPEWELAGGRLGHAVREHRDLFEDKSVHSMDWYYPVLGGAVRGRDAFELLDSRWDDFVRPGPRHPLRRHQPVGDRRRDLRAGDGARHPRRPPARARRCSRTCSTCARTTAATGPAGSTATSDTDPESGEPRNVHWPVEHTTYTAAAVILAVDALGEVAGHSTAGSGIMRGTSLAPHFAELALECGCPSADERRRASPDVRRSTRIEPSASTSVKAPLSSARRKTWYGGCPPSAGSGNTSWMTSSPSFITQGAQPE